MIREFTMWLMALGLVPSLGFVLLYGLTSPWWRSAGGRHLMSFAIAAFLLFLWGFLTLLLDEYTGRRTLRLLVTVAFASLAWWRFLVLLHLHFGLLRSFYQDKELNDWPPPSG